MASTAKERAFNRALLSQRRKLASQTQKFDGAAKQYVRVYGWLEYIKDFISRRTEAGVTTPCKYLTLPGPNMTDIGVLWNAGLFSRLVFPKLIAKYAMTFGYKVIEHFAAYYSRQRDDETNYYMLSHTLELEPLKPTKERETFLPCFDKVPENEHQEKTRVLLTEDNRDKAAEAYSNFVKALPMKLAVNVDQFLAQNAALKATMQHEEQALLNWWEGTALKERAEHP